MVLLCGTLPAYREFKRDFQDTVGMLPLVGAPLARWTESVKEAVANYMNPGHLFRELGAVRHPGRVGGDDGVPPPAGKRPKRQYDGGRWARATSASGCSCGRCRLPA